MNINKLFSSKLTWPPFGNKRLLPPDDAKTVFHLFDAIDVFVLKESGIGQRVAAAKKPVDSDVLRREIRNYYYNNPVMVDQFIQSTEGADLTDEQKQLLISWKNPLRGKFLCIKYYAKYAIVTPMDDEGASRRYYAILGLSNDFDVMIPDKPPYLITTALLPYKDVIIWDGVIGHHGIRFGRSIANTLTKAYQRFKQDGRLILRLS